MHRPTLIRLAALLPLAAAALGGGVAHAADLAPRSAIQVTLGDMAINAYYVTEPDGMRVVTTAQAVDTDQVIRFVTTLRDGQAALISVPRAAGSSALELRLKRTGDRVTISGPVS